MYQSVKNSDGVRRLSDGAFIPVAPGNSDYEAYLQWRFAGNTPQTADTPDPKAIAQAELNALEQTTLMNRLLREFMLVSMQDLAQRQSELLHANGIERSPQDILNASPGWNKLVEVNTQATNLRKEIV